MSSPHALKTLQLFPLILRVKSKLLTLVYEAQMIWLLSPHAHSAPILVFQLFLETHKSCSQLRARIRQDRIGYATVRHNL